MHKNPLWIGLVGLALITTLFFSSQAGWQLNRWQKLKAHTEGRVEKWEIIKLGKDRFALDATYRYTVNGEDFFETGRLLGERFLNRWAAEAHQREVESVRVWYPPDQPHHPQLGRYFPYKSCFYSLLCAGLLIYFLALGRRVARA